MKTFDRHCYAVQSPTLQVQFRRLFMLTEVVEKQRPLSAGAEVKLIVLLKNYNKTITEIHLIYLQVAEVQCIYI